jgi:capsular exopolysaccharide synthesis family protein
MSKYFETIEQMEKDPLLDSEPMAASAAATEFRAGRQQWAAEEALSIVQTVFQRQSQEQPRVVVFAGVDHGSGCSQICATVAESLARHRTTRVCLVEANFRSPALPAIFGTTNHFGLTNALLGAGPICCFAKPVVQDNLWLLSAGACTEDSPNLLTSDNLRERVKEMRKDFDSVIIDAPPLTRYSDAVVLGQLSDGLVLVLEAGTTRREAAFAAAKTLRSANIPILTAVLNKRTFPIPKSVYRMV